MRNIFLALVFLLGSPTINCVIDSTLFDGCGVTKTCAQAIPGSCSTACTPSTCRLLYTIENVPAESKLLIGLHSDGNYRYMALGFSNDRSMIDSDVLGCEKTDANTAVVKDAFNPTRTNVNDNDNSAISNFTYEIDGNAFSCVFFRDYLPQDASVGYSLNSGSYYLFLSNRNPGGFGTQISDFPQHTITPCITDDRIDLLSLSNVTSSSPDYSLTRAHGMLMILAWTVFIGTGVFMASYTKLLFPNGEWFQFHKYINSLALIIALIGVALIFISLGEWKSSGPGMGGSLLAHQLIGLTSILFMLLNPIIAAFRCRPAAKSRRIFNSIHSGVGRIAIILSTIAIFLGLVLYYNLIGRTILEAPAFWIYLVRVVSEWFFFVPLIAYCCYKCKCQAKNKETKEKTDKEMPLPKINPIKLFLHNIFAPPQCPTGEKRKKPVREWPILLVVLIAFIVYNLCFYIAIVITVALSEQ